MQGWAVARATTRGRPLGVHAVHEPRRVPVRARARHRARRGPLHRPAVDGGEPGRGVAVHAGRAGRAGSSSAGATVARGARSTGGPGASPGRSRCMLAKLTLALAVVAAFAAPAAAGDGPLFVSQGGVGIAAGSTRYLPVPSYQSGNTILLSLSTKDATEQNQMELVGSVGPAVDALGRRRAVAGRHASRPLRRHGGADRRRASSCVVNPKTMKIVEPITLPGWFSFDAMSPDASKLYFIEYTQGASSGDLEPLRRARVRRAHAAPASRPRSPTARRRAG